MERNFNLIKTDFKEIEKRILPRFPFSYLMFKGNDEKNNKHVFEVRDISFTGMQLSLKNGGHEYVPGDNLNGVLHWSDKDLIIVGLVKWVKGSRLGVKFIFDDGFDEKVHNFLSIENIVSRMKPLHNNAFDLHLPPNLKYWLRADAPFEVFIWQHQDGEMSKFQIVMMNSFVEWQDGLGIRTGKILKLRDHDSPLFSEDEFMFQMDDGVELDKIKLALEVVNKVPEEYLPEEISDFLKLKLAHN